MFYALVILAAASRCFPHPPNFACIGALGLFAGCYLRGRLSPIVPLAALLLSDLAGHWLELPGMGFYSPIAMVGVYGGFALAASLGRLLQRQRGPFRVAAAACGSAVIFFLLSNLGVWASGMYPATWEGLVACYTAALPFFRYTLAGDLVYTGVLFGAFEMVRLQLPQRLWGGKAILPA